MIGDSLAVEESVAGPRDDFAGVRRRREIDERVGSGKRVIGGGAERLAIDDEHK